MNIIGIIPARYESTRFPGKPLAIIKGKTMIQRVYEQAKKSESLQKVVVATDNKIIQQHVEQFGGIAVMTSPNHQSGTDRCFEALQHIEKDNKSHFDILINIQGDEPYINPKQINMVAEQFSNPQIEIATLIHKITNPQQLSDSNTVKVVFDNNGKALYFTRATIPYNRNQSLDNWLENGDYYKHIGIYGFRKETLKKVISLPQGELEKIECLEQLRWLQHGFSIHTAITNFDSYGIDTYEDFLKL